MMSRHLATASSLVLCAIPVLLAACANLEYAPKAPSPIMYYPRELPAADRAVEGARNAGKATQCPDAFREAEKLRDDAYATYWACRTADALALANQATSKANALCPVAMQPAPPPPAPAPVAPTPPPPPPSPTATISANPATIQQGQCTSLSWSSTNSTSATVSPGVGGVAVSGSQQVCPTSTTQYTMVATGAGGSANASTTVNVTPPPPPPPKEIARLTLRINFDTDKAIIRQADVPELQKAVDFIKKYPTSAKVTIEGHTDNRASAAYNQRLSERRAQAVKDYLLKAGVPNGSRMATVGYGLTKPVADNSTERGRFTNRRTEIVISSE